MKRITIIACMLLISACNNDSSSDNDKNDTPDPVVKTNYTYDITLSNLTNAQPISPPIAVLHAMDYKAWQLGEPASVALEYMAEGGMNSFLIEEAETRPTTTAEGALGPGKSQTLTISSEDKSLNMLTIAGMLVNTNDAFTGANALSLADLAVDETMSLITSAYDSGTEANSEDVNTMPGPAAGGQGFSAARDDFTSVVTMHSGIVSRDDGFAESALTEAHRFDNPVMKITITRTE